LLLLLAYLIAPEANDRDWIDVAGILASTIPPMHVRITKARVRSLPKASSIIIEIMIVIIVVVVVIVISIVHHPIVVARVVALCVIILVVLLAHIIRQKRDFLSEQRLGLLPVYSGRRCRPHTWNKLLLAHHLIVLQPLPLAELLDFTSPLEVEPDVVLGLLG